MAYTSVIPVYRLDNAVRYAQDKQKTTRQHGMPLAETVDYALNREKTETDCFESGLGCTTQSAYEDMRANAVRWHKTDGVQGYHLVQSFAEGEVTPELAHKIGLELAERVLGGRYQAIVTTHLNTSHYHNHIVWSSVAMNSGRKYHSNAKSYALEIRAVSDELCVKYGLSIIQTERAAQVSKPYAEWLAEKNGQPTWRTVIRQDVDAALAEALTWRQFIRELESKGYELNFNHKYPTLRPPGKTRKRLAGSIPQKRCKYAFCTPTQGGTFYRNSRPLQSTPDCAKAMARPAGSPACGPCTIAICTSWVRCRISPAAPAMLYGRTSVILTAGSGRWNSCQKMKLILWRSCKQSNPHWKAKLPNCKTSANSCTAASLAPRKFGKLRPPSNRCAATLSCARRLPPTPLKCVSALRMQNANASRNRKQNRSKTKRKQIKKHVKDYKKWSDDMFNSNRDRYHAEYARRHYPVGTKIRLLAMNDPYDPVPPGTIGTVTCVDDAGQLHMDWQNGRTLALVPGVDSFEVLERPAPAKSGKNRGAAR